MCPSLGPSETCPLEHVIGPALSMWTMGPIRILLWSYSFICSEMKDCLVSSEIFTRSNTLGAEARLHLLYAASGSHDGKWWGQRDAEMGTGTQKEKGDRRGQRLVLRPTQFLPLLVMCTKKFIYWHSLEIFSFLCDFILLILVSSRIEDWTQGRIPVR